MQASIISSPSSVDIPFQERVVNVTDGLLALDIFVASIPLRLAGLRMKWLDLPELKFSALE
jgi:hypothetical protein